MGFAVAVLAMCFGMAGSALPASAAPATDAFLGAPAFDITGTRGQALVDLTGGTRETGEPVVAGSATAQTMWWRYVPPANGFAKFSACAPSGLNPMPGMSLGVYTGARVDLLTPVAQGTNNCPSGYDNAQVGPFPVTAGDYYWLQIGGANGLAVDETDAAVTLDFNPAAAPPNDDWASALSIAGSLPQTFAANNGLATVEPGEPRSDATNQRSTLWYRWSAPASGVVSINTCGSAVESGMDSVISVFSASSPTGFGDLTFVDENDNGCPGAAQNLSRVYLNATAGTDYWIKLSNYTVDWGFPYSLQLKWITTPENGSAPGFYPTRLKVGQTTNADTGVWAGNPAPTYSQVWRRCDAAGNNCADIPGATGLSYTAVVADKGSTLRFRVTADNSNGSTFADSAPSEVVDDTPVNDLWANRIDLGSGSTISYNDDNNFSTASETGEPLIGAFTPRNTVWYKWTPAVGGDYVINNCLGGSIIPDYLDLMIGIRTGTSTLATTASAGYGDNGCGPYRTNRTSMLFNATAGTQYSIEVTSKVSTFTGSYTLSIAPVGDPVVTAPPAISGTPAPGSQLAVDVGDWISPTAIVPVIHWLRCDSAGNNCVDTGQTGTLYSLSVADAGAKLKVTVTLTNSYGTVTSSALSPLIAQDSDGDGVLDVSDDCPSEPGNKPNGCQASDIVGSGAPTMSGALYTGQTLSSTTGSWTVLHDPLGYSLAYQWQRCTGTTAGTCSDVGGATNTTYALGAPDVGFRIRAVVTASNSDDPAEVQATAISAVVATPPVAPSNTGLPAVSGTPVVGQTLSTTDGTWTPAGTTQSYAWLRCTDNVSVGSCTTIGGQIASTYALTASDLGKYIRSQVTATNVSGAASAASAATAIITGDSDGDGVPDVSDTCPSEAGTKPNGCLPSVVTGNGAPSIVGPLIVGQTVNSDNGSWTVQHDPLPLSYAYQWQRCNDATAGSCSDIPGESSDTYVLQAADYAKRIRMKVTASNADSSATQFSSISAAIDQYPGNVSLPTISGTAMTGQSLSTTNGTWTPAGTSFTYSWLRCNDNVSVGSCSAIGGATSSSYTLVAADNGKYIRSRVTGTTSAGSDYASSAPSALVSADSDGDGVPDATDTCPAEAGTKPNGCLPSVINGTGVPTLSGTFNVGQSISSTTGSWQVLHDPLGYTLGYQWQRCTGTTAGTCTDIGSATSSSYALQAADYGKRVRIVVTASNADSSASQASAISALVSQLPVNNTLPTVTGTATVGQTLTGGQGSWTPGDATLANAWLRCTDNASTASCSTIAGQTGGSYALAAADDGKYIRLQVSATTAAGTTVATSAPTAIVITDGDGDGVPNASDVCPAEAGTKPNGCLPSVINGTGVPTLSGTFNVGQSISSTTGSWQVLHDPLGYTLTYQWQRCPDTNPANCVSIGSATNSSYTLQAADYGKRIRVVVTATNADGSANQASAISALVSQVPANNTPPSISGVAGVGQTLTANQGSWTPADATLANAWQRCNDNVSTGSCTTIAGQTGSSYTLTAGDNGKYIRVQVTATSTAGSASVFSAATSLVVTDSDGDGVPDATDTCPAEAGTKPNGCLPSVINGIGVPTLSGTFNVGQSIASTTGSWQVLHDPLGYTLAYQWQRCTGTTAGTCTDIGSATSSSYALQAADYGKRVRIVITASNADSSSNQASAISGVVSQVPVNNSVPTVSGTARVGLSLTGGQGTWTPGDATLANAWLRCTDNVSSGSCSVIAGQTGSSYTLVAADDNKYIRLRVTATTAAGSSSVDSAPSAKVFTDTDGDGVVDSSDTCPSEAGTKPNGCLPSVINGTGVPTLSGTFNVGQSIASTTGSWQVLHDPLGYTLAYQWQRCTGTTAGTCTDIGSATSSSYTLQAADYGNRVRVTVTASNADATASQSSAISGVVGQAPVNNTVPAVSGTTRVGQSLTGNQGTWTPVNATLTNAWLRCNDNVSSASCSVIAGQTGSSYTLVAADDNKYVRLRVTATTGAGSSTVDSAPSAKVFTDTDGDGVIDSSDTCPSEAGTKPNGCLPSVINGTGVPTLSGTFNVGQSVSSTTGSWQVLHDPLGYTLSYQWQRCPDTNPANCANIGAATSSAYSLQAADYGKRVRVVVTATNADGSANQASAISNAVSQTPSNSGLPTISGTAKVGQNLSATGGTWTPADATLTYAWQRCSTTSAGSCSPIAGATSSGYTLADADNGQYIRVRVTGTTTAGSASALSAATAQVVKDSDGDGVNDPADACPSEAGAKPNGCPPSDIVAAGAPSVSGNLVVGDTVSSTTGSWTVLHDQLGYTLSYQWQSCPDTTPANCANIGGATSSSYTLQPADNGKRVRVTVTATNADDSAGQSSAITTPVIPAGSAPVNNAPPTIDGSAVAGQTLTAVTGATDWTPADAALSYAWLRCTDDVSTASCSAIFGETAATYTLTAGDVGAYVRVRVTATANSQSTDADSSATVKVTAAPVPPAGGGTTQPKNPAEITGPAALKKVKPAKKTGKVTFSQVSVYCGTKASGNCTGSAVLTGKIGGKKVKLGTAKLSTRRGGGTTITVKLSSKTLKALKKKAVKAQLAVTYSAPGFAPLAYAGSTTLKKLG